MSLLGHFLELFVQCLGSLCTFNFIDKIVPVQYIVQIFCRETYRRGVWITKQTSLASVLLHDEESDALHKINDYIYKDTEHKFFGC